MPQPHSGPAGPAGRARVRIGGHPRPAAVARSVAWIVLWTLGASAVLAGGVVLVSGTTPKIGEVARLVEAVALIVAGVALFATAARAVHAGVNGAEQCDRTPQGPRVDR